MYNNDRKYYFTILWLFLSLCEHNRLYNMNTYKVFINNVRFNIYKCIILYLLMFFYGLELITNNLRIVN